VKGKLPGLQADFSKGSQGQLQYRPNRGPDSGSLESFKPEGLGALVPRLTQKVLHAAGELEHRKYGDVFPLRDLDIQKAFKNPDGSVAYSGQVRIPDKNGAVKSLPFDNMLLSGGGVKLRVHAPFGVANNYDLKMLGDH
jgi:hypothetical protein